jgi:hypothetical protein
MLEISINGQRKYGLRNMEGIPASPSVVLIVHRGLALQAD